MEVNSTENLCLVIPAFNEEGCIEKVITNWASKLSEQSIDYSIIVINDGSSDKTGKIVDALQESNPRIVSVHQANSGHGNTVVAGYKLALANGPRWVFQVDSDDQFYPKDFFSLWSKRNTSPFILGARVQRNDPFFRLVITWILRWFLFLIFQTKIFDSNIPFRLIRSDYLKELMRLVPHTYFTPNILLSVTAKKQGIDLLEIPVGHEVRRTGANSLISWGLLKVCFKVVLELFIFRLKLKDNRVKVRA